MGEVESLLVGDLRGQIGDHMTHKPVAGAVARHECALLKIDGEMSQPNPRRSILDDQE
ncbi:hypothetical protein Pen01_41020 [Phytomonospora endophytica]|nr:hypothetical protein Pen01_41020 [Phytomonospora endophytica]